MHFGVCVFSLAPLHLTLTIEATVSLLKCQLLSVLSESPALASISAQAIIRPVWSGLP